MKDLRIYVPLLLALFICRAVWLTFPQGEAKYVFINETSDHRFDESIRTSILAAQMRAGVQNAVVITDCTVDSTAIEDQAAQAFKDLNLGEKNLGRAILYYFCPQKKSLKIEIGYELEGILPDVLIFQLEQAAKTFIFNDHYQDFWAELLITINIEISLREKSKKSEKNASSFDFSKKTFQFFSGGAGVTSSSYEATWEQFQKESAQKPSKKSKDFKASADLDSSVQIYLKSLHQGVGEPSLDILTLESQFFRGQIPRTNYQMIRNGKMYQRAGVHRSLVEGSLAFVFFREGHPVLPLVFRNEDGVWRVHEPFSWSLFQRFEDSNKVFFKFPLTNLSNEMKKYIDENFSVPLYPLKNPLDVKELGASHPVFKNFSTYLIHLYWLDRVEKELSSLNLADLSSDELAFAADSYMNLGQMTSFLKVYSQLVQKENQNLTLKRNLEFYKSVLEFKDSEWQLSRK